MDPESKLNDFPYWLPTGSKYDWNLWTKNCMFFLKISGRHPVIFIHPSPSKEKKCHTGARKPIQGSQGLRSKHGSMLFFFMAQSIYLLNSDETSGSGYLEGEYIFFFKWSLFSKQLWWRLFLCSCYLKGEDISGWYMDERCCFSMMYILKMQFCWFIRGWKLKNLNIGCFLLKILP